jgi:HlyD family secretion protein
VVQNISILIGWWEPPQLTRTSIMKFSIRTIIWTFVLIAIAIVGAMALIPKPAEVETAIATEGDLRITVKEDGKTRIREKYIVSAPVAGRLSRIELEPGDEVCDENRLIAVILPAEPTMLDARSKAQAKARVEQAIAAQKRAAAATEQIQVNHDLSNTKFVRAKRLIESNAISRDEYDVARADFLAQSQSIRTSKFDEEIAKYELDMARATLLQYSDDPQATTKPFEIFAPVCGKVLRVFQESSTDLSVGTPLIEMGDPQNIEMEIDVLSTDAVRIRAGATITIEQWGGESPLMGTVRVIEPAAFTKVSSLGVEEQRVNIIADFQETDERLATLGDGYRVEAQITIAQLNNVLLIPNSALFRHERVWHVFLIEAGTAVMKPVSIGAQNDTYTQIQEGLVQQDEVILYPSDTVSNGSKVKRAN